MIQAFFKHFVFSKMIHSKMIHPGLFGFVFGKMIQVLVIQHKMGYNLVNSPACSSGRGEGDVSFRTYTEHSGVAHVLHSFQQFI